MSTRGRLWVLGVVLAGGCNRPKPVDVAPIAAEDESLKHSETELLGRRGALQRERKQIAQARAALVERRQTAAADPGSRAALEEEERTLFAKESDLADQESQVNDKLDSLLKMRGELVRRATQVVASGPGVDPLERAARREQGVASREKEVATREGELAAREQQLAEREAQLARREKDTCGTTTVVSAPKIELPKGLKYAARDVEPVYKKALNLMRERGLQSADLPPGSSRLIDEVREAMKRADYVRAKYGADQLLATVSEIKIDRAFIGAKMARLAAAMKGKKLDGAERKVMEGLFQEATANYGDGKFREANQLINKLFSQLK